MDCARTEPSLSRALTNGLNFQDIFHMDPRIEDYAEDLLYSSHFFFLARFVSSPLVLREF
jgi:hypothetical protein